MKEIFKYLRNNYTSDPILIDRLIVSSFLRFNNIIVENNIFIQDYIITNTQLNENESVNDFIELLRKESIEFDFETLIELFEFVVSPDDKIITGAIYTPKNIRKYIIEQSLTDRIINDNFKLADISCGCGSFLYEATIYIHQLTGRSYSQIINNNIFGLDIQEYSTIRTKIVLTLLAISGGEDIPDFIYNIHTGDALNFNWIDYIVNFNGLQCVVGNPPYVCSRNISADTKKYLSNWSVCSTGHPDLYIPFFQIGIENLAENGVLGFITMNSFFKSINGRALREYFQRISYQFKIIDFGNKQIFKSKSTYTCICLIERRNNNFIQYVKNQTDNLNIEYAFNQLNYDELDFKNGWNLEDSDKINKIEGIGKPLGELYKTRNGIATLKNNIYILNLINEDDNFYYLKNEKEFKIEKGICRNIINPNRFTKIDNVEDVIKKIIFPYQFVESKVELISEEHFQNTYPFAYDYLKSKKDILGLRDKEKGNYENWFAYGRNQSLEKMRNKLFFPHITPDIPNFVINTDEELLFHNGLAVVTENERELYFLQKLMSSKLFWFYIKNSSKPYGSDYYSLSKNYIKNFGIYNFSEEQKEYIINEDNKEILDAFFEEKYNIKL